MAKKLDNIENRSRRSNLIVYCVNKQGNESTELFETDVVKDIFGVVFGVMIFGVERIHRLGRPKQGDDRKSRPIILKIADYRDKANIMKNCSKLKGSAIFIGEDFS